MAADAEYIKKKVVHVDMGRGSRLSRYRRGTGGRDKNRWAEGVRDPQ